MYFSFTIFGIYVTRRAWCQGYQLGQELVWVFYLLNKRGEHLFMHDAEHHLNILWSILVGLREDPPYAPVVPFWFFSVPNSEAAGAACFQGLNATSCFSIMIFLTWNLGCFPFPYHFFVLTWTVTCSSGGKFSLGSWGYVCTVQLNVMQRDLWMSCRAGRSPIPSPPAQCRADMLSLFSKLELVSLYSIVLRL